MLPQFVLFHCVIPDRRDDDELGLERKLFCEWDCKFGNLLESLSILFKQAEIFFYKQSYM